jgi:hypothetical protein
VLLNDVFLFRKGTEQVDISPIAVFKEKAFAIFTVTGFIAIAGAEFGKVSLSFIILIAIIVFQH